MKNQENTVEIFKGKFGYDLALKDPEHWEARRFGETEWSPYSVWGKWCYKKCENKHTQWQNTTPPRFVIMTVSEATDWLLKAPQRAVIGRDGVILSSHDARFNTLPNEQNAPYTPLIPAVTNATKASDDCELICESIRTAKRDAWQEGYDRRDRREPGGTANNPYHENYQGFNNYPTPETITADPMTAAHAMQWIIDHPTSFVLDKNGCAWFYRGSGSMCMSGNVLRQGLRSDSGPYIRLIPITQSQVVLEAEIATLRAELQKERCKVRQYVMAIDAIDATASQFRNCTQNETSKQSSKS